METGKDKRILRSSDMDSEVDNGELELITDDGSPESDVDYIVISRPCPDRT